MVPSDRGGEPWGGIAFNHYALGILAHRNWEWCHGTYTLRDKEVMENTPCSSSDKVSQDGFFVIFLASKTVSQGEMTVFF